MRSSCTKRNCRRRTFVSRCRYLLDSAQVSRCIFCFSVLGLRGLAEQVEEVLLPELPERVHQGDEPAQARALRLRPRAQVQVPVLRDALERDLERVQAHQDQAPGDARLPRRRGHQSAVLREEELTGPTPSSLAYTVYLEDSLTGWKNGRTGFHR